MGGLSPARGLAGAEDAGPSGRSGWVRGTVRQTAVAAAVGPEGGFTDEEVDQARAAGWEVVGLGPRILRVETAAMVLAVESATHSG